MISYANIYNSIDTCISIFLLSPSLNSNEWDQGIVFKKSLNFAILFVGLFAFTSENFKVLK